MTKVEEIQATIETLPSGDFVRLRRWFLEIDWEQWDAQIESDSDSGRLDFLIREAKDSKLKGELKDL